MKIFFPVEQLNGMNSILDERFGRAPYFLIVDTDNQKVILEKENPFAQQDHGVGVSIANYVIQEQCTAAAGNRFGPKAGDILKSAGIRMIEVQAAERETVQDVLNRINS